jgi:hypothetical protein
MSEQDEGRVRFLDGMRVTIEHMEHLQALWLSAAVQLRKAIGTGKVSYGLRVEPAPDNKVKVGSGLAFDRKGHPLALEEEREVALDFGVSKTLYLTLVYAQRSGGIVNGVPTLVFNELKIVTRADAPPYTDDAVVFAELQGGDGAVSVVQRGEWYMPPLDHGHSGEFKLDAGLRWRYDGHALASQAPRFDSGFIPVPASSHVQLIHGLKTTHLVVQLQARRENGIITTEGFGERFWYELVGDQEVHLSRRPGGDEENLELRVMLWPTGQTGGAPLLPISDAGDDVVADFGESFRLDASRSRAFGGRKLVKYIWQQFS